LEREEFDQHRKEDLRRCVDNLKEETGIQDARKKKPGRSKDEETENEKLHSSAPVMLGAPVVSAPVMKISEAAARGNSNQGHRSLRCAPVMVHWSPYFLICYPDVAFFLPSLASTLAVIFLSPKNYVIYNLDLGSLYECLYNTIKIIINYLSHDLSIIQLSTLMWGSHIF